MIVRGASWTNARFPSPMQVAPLYSPSLAGQAAVARAPAAGVPVKNNFLRRRTVTAENARALDVAGCLWRARGCATGSTVADDASMGRPFKQYLDGPRIYSCSTCRSHVADHDDIVSKARPLVVSLAPVGLH